jgi:hypothetical protein
VADHEGKGTAPPRGALPLDVLNAACQVSVYVWSEPYQPGEGPMHHAGGPYWHEELLRRAAHWERLAAAARVCAGWLPTDGGSRG